MRSVITALLCACAVTFAAASAFPLTRLHPKSINRKPKHLIFCARSEPNDGDTVANLPWVYAQPRLPIDSAFFVKMHICFRYGLLALSMLLLSAADPVMDAM